MVRQFSSVEVNLSTLEEQCLTANEYSEITRLCAVF
jgi:hypothetical protein